MVKKLFKHEVHALARLLIPVWCVLLGVAALGRMVQLFERDNVMYNIINGSSLLFYGVVLAACLACPVVFAVIRFYRNLFTGEGYLMFTLPVTSAQHLWVKLLVAIAAEVATWMVAVLSVAVITFGEVTVELGKAIIYLIKRLADVCDGHLPLLTIEAVLALVLMAASGLLLYYACICIGQMAKKGRIFVAIATYFGYYALSQVFGTIMSIAMAFVDMEKLLLWVTEHGVATAHIVLCYYIVSALVLGGIFYIVSHFVMSRRLNLE